LQNISLVDDIFGILHGCEKFQQRHLLIDERRSDKIEEHRATVLSFYAITRDLINRFEKNACFFQR